MLLVTFVNQNSTSKFVSLAFDGMRGYITRQQFLTGLTPQRPNVWARLPITIGVSEGGALGCNAMKNPAVPATETPLEWLEFNGATVCDSPSGSAGC